MRRGNTPDIDPANNDTLAGCIRFAFKKLFGSTDGMLPAQIMSYNRTTNRAQVQILIPIVGTDGSIVSRPQIASIPVLILGGGNLMLNFPLKAGDLGWICANDRDISLFLQTYQQAEPNTPRMANFADGVFIPDRMREYVISDDDADNVVLGTVDGTVKISVGAAGVNIVAPNATVQSPNVTVQSPSITIAPIPPSIVPTNINIGSIIMSEQPPGFLHVHGSITASGSIIPGVPP